MYNREKQAFIYIALQTILIIPYLPVLRQNVAEVLYCTLSSYVKNMFYIWF